MKKLISLVVVVAVLATLCCVLTGCNSQPTEGLEYSLNSDQESYSVIGMGTAIDTDIVIASTYESLPVTAVGGQAFYFEQSITSVYIPNSIITIEESAFEGCSEMTKVTFQSNSQVTAIEARAFSCCYELESISLPSGITRIAEVSFGSCHALTKITIPDGVTEIGFMAFNSCSSLEKVTFGSESQLVEIDDHAFSSCKSLTSFEIVDTVQVLGWGVFNYTTSITEFVVEEGNTCFSTIDGSLYSADGSKLIQYTLANTDTSFVVPDSVTDIASGAFEFSPYLESVTIGSNVDSIEDWVFFGCEVLESVHFPEGSEWYVTLDGIAWLANSGGELMNVSYATTNAETFTGKYCNYYWYKG